MHMNIHSKKVTLNLHIIIIMSYKEIKMLKNIIENSTIYSAKKIIKNSMNSYLTIKDIDYEVKRDVDKNKPYLLYMHIPFCETFCPYCSFHKFKYDEETAKRYFISLRKEMRKVKEEGFKFDSLYVGGGTTLIHEDELLKTLKLAKELFNIEDISCESDPNHISPDTIKKFQGLIKRLSIGVQSFDDGVLKKVARYDKFGSAKQIQEKISAIKGMIPMINIDLIFNFPGQSEEMLLKDLKCAKNLGVEQVTTYPLMSTDLTLTSITKAFEEKHNTKEHHFYKIIQEQFTNYSLSNAWSFSKEVSDMSDEYLAKHNEYVGIGSGAFSFLDGNLYVNAYDLNEYAQLISKQPHAIIASSSFKPKQRIQYQFLTWLFNGAIEIEDFDETFDCNLTKVLKQEIYMLKTAHAIKIEDGKIQPTEFGKYLSLIMMKEFYSGMDMVRAMFKQKTLEKVSA